MAQHDRAPRSTLPLVLLLGALGVLAAAADRTPTTKQSGAAPSSSLSAHEGSTREGRARYTTEVVRGRVVWVEDALARLYGVSTDPATAETAVVLETPEGRLLPIVPDVRGRAFMVDARLRGIDLELLVRRYEGAPMIQTIRVFRPKPDGLYELDYWCDVCAIPMVILKDCECCQGPTRLREQRVERSELRLAP